LTGRDVQSSIASMPQTRARQRILLGARNLLQQGRGDRVTVAEIARAAGTSKAAFYRAFGSRAELMAALRLDPEPDAHQRVLEAALELIGVHGLANLSMDDVAARAEVSRANLYRLFPGKDALFLGVMHAFSPLDPVSEAMKAMSDQPPAVVMPELARTIYRKIALERIGLLRALFFEVSSMSPDTEAAAQDIAAAVLGTVGMYVMTQMQQGRLRSMHPILALQSFVGPIFFFLMTRQLAGRVLGLDIDGEAAVTALAEGWLRAMKPD
jgi:AcrR family transcriptional regulator